MIVASIHGRLGRDAEMRQTRAGKPMALASVVVEVNKPGEDGPGLWLSLLAFGDEADQLGRCTKGETISAFGKMTRSTFTGQGGVARESWSLICDGLVTARSARPSGRKRTPRDPAMQGPVGTYASDGPEARGAGGLAP